MSDGMTPDAYGHLTEPTTLTIRRLLPGSVERVWAYLTQSDLRRKWLAAGNMEMAPGTPFTFVWRNDELTNPPGERPADFSPEHSLDCGITAVDPPRLLVIRWGAQAEVSFALDPQGDKVLLTVVHRRLPDRDMLLKVSAGWHAHLDILANRLGGSEPEPFWDEWLRLRAEYGERLPA